MVPVDSHKVSRAPRYSGYHYQLYTLPILDYHYLRLSFPTYSSSIYNQMSWSYYPSIAVTILVWATLRSLATTYRITIVFSSSAYLDVSVQQVCPPYGVSCIQHDGLPHSDICGSNRMCQSPQLFAAYHVLLRLWEPRHPPYALNKLIYTFNNITITITLLVCLYSINYTYIP